MLFMVVEKFRNQDGKAVYRADWQDIVDFEVVPVVEGKATREAPAPLL